MDAAAPPSPALSRRQGEAAKNKPACVHWYVCRLLFLVYQGVLGLYSVQLQRTAAAGTGILLEDVEGVALSAFLFLGVAYSLSHATAMTSRTRGAVVRVCTRVQRSRSASAP